MEWTLRVKGLGDHFITRWDSKRIASLPPSEREQLKSVVDTAGERSAKAQGLGAVITDVGRIHSYGHILYLAANCSDGKTTVLGLLKIGRKKLFIRVDSGALREIEPLCVLDFYVHESCQRSGVGKQLMDHMLEENNQMPNMLGYDRPSHKLLSFLNKYYGLSDFIPQSNNFVVFRSYFQTPSSRTPSSSQHGNSKRILSPHEYGSTVHASRQQRANVQSQELPLSRGQLAFEHRSGNRFMDRKPSSNRQHDAEQEEAINSHVKPPRFGRRALDRQYSASLNPETQLSDVEYKKSTSHGGQCSVFQATSCHGQTFHALTPAVPSELRDIFQDPPIVQIPIRPKKEKDSISKLHASDSPQLQINNISPKPTVDGRLYGQGRVADLTLKPQIVSMSPAKAMALKHREGAGAKGAMAW